MNEDSQHKPIEIETKTIMDGPQLLSFLRGAGVDVNLAIENALKNSHSKLKPGEIIDRILGDKEGMLSRWFRRPRATVLKRTPASIQRLTNTFEEFVLNILSPKKKTNPEKPTDTVELSEEEENSVLLSELMRDINTLKTRWSDNYDELTESILDFLSLLSDVYQDPEPGPPHRYEYDPDEEEANEEFFSDDALQPQMNESEYIPYNLLNTIVWSIEVFNAKAVALGMKLHNPKNKKHFQRYIHELKVLLTLLEKIQKLRWSLFSYYPDTVNPISTMMKGTINTINVYIEEFRPDEPRESWWGRFIKRKNKPEPSDSEPDSD